jgi:hypothetical protein
MQRTRERLLPRLGIADYLQSFFNVEEVHQEIIPREEAAAQPVSRGKTTLVNGRLGWSIQQPI